MAVAQDAQRLVVAAEEVGAWAACADVIVVGYGIAGVSAAIAAREAGGRPLVLERSGGSTGSTAAASGHFYLGGGTPVQTACGFTDSAEAVEAYWTAVTERPDPAKVEAFAKEGVDQFRWLEQRGVPFDRSYYPEKAVIQPGRDCLIWTGNENVWPFRDVARPAPRGHKVAFDGEEGGGLLALERLIEHAGRIGVEAQHNTHVDALVMRNGRVVGVRARQFGETLFFSAEAGVVLAGGGFGRNPEMMAQHLARFAGVEVVGGPYDDGLAIRLGVAAGGAVENMDGMLVTSPIYPPEKLIKGILVNSRGERFIAEDSYHTRASLSILEQPDRTAYLIVDSEIFAYPAWHDHANQRLVDGYASVAAMEKDLGMPEGALQTTIQRYNAAARAGADPEHHKHPDWLKPLDVGPWAAFDFSFGRAIFYGFTLGGLRISAMGEVLDAAGAAIPRLFAAGACAAMLAHTAHNYASGISLSAGSFFGRRAGVQAMQTAAAA